MIFTDAVDINNEGMINENAKQDITFILFWHFRQAIIKTRYHKMPPCIPSSNTKLSKEDSAKKIPVSLSALPIPLPHNDFNSWLYDSCTILDRDAALVSSPLKVPNIISYDSGNIIYPNIRSRKMKNAI